MKAYYEFSNFYFIPFPKPCLQFRWNETKEKRLQDHTRKCKECEKSDKWVKFYGRRNDKFNLINKVRSYTPICSLHFVGEAGPQNNIQMPLKKPLIRLFLTSKNLCFAKNVTNMMFSFFQICEISQLRTISQFVN